MRIDIVFLITVAAFSTILNNNGTEAFSIYWSPPGLYSPERTIQNKPVTSEIKQNYCRFLEGHKFIFGYKLCFAILLKKLKSSLKKEEVNFPRRKILVSTITEPSPTKNPAILHALRPFVNPRITLLSVLGKRRPIQIRVSEISIQERSQLSNSHT